MSDPKFFQTGMGHRFYEHTVPELLKQLTRLNDLLERLVTAKESTDGTPQPHDPDDR